jgi:DNA polymerase III subunit epsilon
MGTPRWLQSLGIVRAPVDESRWVVLDVETSGLDPHAARLLAIAAIGVRVDWHTPRLGITLGDSFEVVLAQQQVSARDNILLHGIGAQRQRSGVPSAQGLRDFAAFAGDAPLLAFHAAFDQTLLDRDAKLHLGAALPNRWADIE